MLYLIIIACGLFAELGVRSQLIEAGDPAATAQNIVDSPMLFRAGLAADIVMFIADVALAIVLYQLFKPLNRTLSMLAAAFRLTQTAVIGLNLLNMFQAVRIVDDANYLNVFADGHADALALLYLDAHKYGYLLGLAFFGASTLIISYLALSSRQLPRPLGVLLGLAGAGYLVDTFSFFLIPGYDGSASPIVLAPALIAEVWFALWLLTKGQPARTPDPDREHAARGARRGQPRDGRNRMNVPTVTTQHRPLKRTEHTMKAITRDRFGSPDVLHYVDIERPTLPEGSVLVEVQAAGVNRGDALEMRGWPYVARLMGYGVRRPKHAVLGTDVAGHVVAVDDDVDGVDIGDEIVGFGTGAFAELATVPAGRMIQRPDQLSAAEAAAMPTPGVAALQAIRDAGSGRSRTTSRGDRRVRRRRHLCGADRQGPRSDGDRRGRPTQHRPRPVDRRRPCRRLHDR